MDAIRITVEVPTEVASGATGVALAEEARLLLVLERHRTGDLSATRAARVLGVSRMQFHELCAAHDVPVIRYDADDFRREIAEIRAQGR
jgi:predicted HTH domain antitoxin